MPKDIHTQDSSQQRASRLLLAMGVIVLLGALAYFGLTLAVNRRTPANPDTHFDAENGISVDYESAVWPVCQMTEDAALGHALQLASGEDSANANYQVVLFQRGDKATYEDFIGQSEADLKAAYGVISPARSSCRWRVPRSLPCAVISRPTTPCWPPSNTTAAMWSMSPA